MKGFEIAVGSVAGRSHVEAGRNNQDAFCHLEMPDCSIAIVCDGCTGSLHSEVGAQIGSRLIVQGLANSWRSSNCTLLANGRKGLGGMLERVRQDIVAELRVLANQMGNLSAVVNDYFLFTAVGALVTPEGVAIFSLGDGMFSVNGKITPLGPFPGNAPPYLGYGVIGSQHEARPELVRFEVQRMIPTEDVQSLMIGTDGVMELAGKANCKMPGKEELIGPLSQFWENDHYFINPDALRRKLALINRNVSRFDQDNHLVKEVGQLADDTTLVVVRREAR